MVGFKGYAPASNIFVYKNTAHDQVARGGLFVGKDKQKNRTNQISAHIKSFEKKYCHTATNRLNPL